jgi:hypothetical protein
MLLGDANGQLAEELRVDGPSLGHARRPLLDGCEMGGVLGLADSMPRPKEEAA